MTFHNDGIYVTGQSTFNAKGPVAVGQGARAESATSDDAWADVRRQAQELLARIHAQAPGLPGGPDLVTTAEATVEELDRSQPRAAVLRSHFAALVAGIGSAGELAHGLVALEHAVLALF